MQSSSSRWSHESSFTNPCYQTSIDDDYIDMDVSSSFLCYSIKPNSPSHPSKEFEFQMFKNSNEKEPTTSPADELFYKGKLLPLHLPPRLQMVQNLLHNTEPKRTGVISEGATPFDTCNVTPSDSFHFSGEQNPNGNFHECSLHSSSVVQDSIFMNGGSKKPWSKKLRIIKQSSLGSKLKASRAYIKSLFIKSACSDEPCGVHGKGGGNELQSDSPVFKNNECSNKYLKVSNRNPFGQIQRESYQIVRTIKESVIEHGNQRKSFSCAIKARPSSASNKSLSLSSTSSLKRSNSANLEVERSIMGAIAHCKRSQQLVCSRKSTSEVGLCSLSVSRIAACESQEMPRMCRG